MTNSCGKGVRIAALGLAAATVLSLTAPAYAAKGRRAKAPAPTAQSGMMVAIDPATGKIRQPTAAESKALVAGIQEMTKASSVQPELKQLADGTMSVDLSSSFLNISMAQVQPDGSIREVCVDSAADANAVLTAAPAFEDK
ncbi:MAG: hypothetical protein ABIS20_04570 [Thermoanaerobaculia bacterium]